MHCETSHRHFKKQTVFKAYLSGRHEVPPNGSHAFGTLIALLSQDKTRLDYILHTHNLSNITVAHFHKGDKGMTGPAVKDIDINPITGIATGSWQLTDPTQPLTPEMLHRLKHGNIYVNVHTTTYPNGEIRGQVFLDCE